jgi:tetratricopeptide (TPR) repeat protein
MFLKKIFCLFLLANSNLFCQDFDNWSVEDITKKQIDSIRNLYSANDLIKRGVEKSFKENYQGAFNDFSIAILIEPNGKNTPEAYFERAQLKRRKFKDFKGALGDYNLSLKYNPNYIRAYMYRGLLYNRNFRDFEAAEKDYRKSVELDPKCGSCWMQLGYLNERLDLDEMSDAIDKAIKLGIDLNFDGRFAPLFPLYGRLASFKIAEKDYRGAIKSFQRLIDNYEEIDSDGDGKMDETGYLSDAYFNISVIYYQYLIDKDLALEFINKAIEINPADKDYFAHRAKLKYAANDIKSALEDYSTAKKTITKEFYNTVHEPSDFYPYQDLSRDLDSIKFPVTFNTRIDINDILGLETSNNQFFLSVNYDIFSKIDQNFINYKKDTLTIFDLEKFVEPIYIGSDKLFERKIKYEGYDDINITDEVVYSGYIETDFFHNWDLKEYPFDKQRLQFQIGISIDSSIVRLNQSNFYKSSFKKVKGLKEGYKIEKIEFEEIFKEQVVEEIFYPGVIRKEVYPIANYNIIISRSGGWLFLKLFLGSFLAFLISWIVFLIPNKEFDSRISLTVGGIFGAIGNRYFVDSTIPAVQVLTKADMINNLILALLILNVLIVIVQKNDKISFGKLEDNKFAMVFTGVSFIVLNALIVIL